MAVLPANERVEGLRKLRQDKVKSTRSEKLFYKGSTQPFDVFPIDQHLLIFNRHNGRIESEMLTWAFEHDVGQDEYNDEVEARIADFLWNTNVERNKATLEDLKAKQQLRPGIVSLDGVIIDGNRRAMLLRKLGLPFEAVILPDEYHENEREIVKLETEYQIGEDAKLDYGPLEKYLKVKRLKRSLGYEEDEIAKMMGVRPGEVERLLGIMDLMDQYLEIAGYPNLYNMLKEADNSTKEGMFVDLYQDIKRLTSNAVIPWAYDPVVDVLELTTIQFDYIRYGNGSGTKGLYGSGKDYRQISHDQKGESTFFANQEIWDAFRSEHRSRVVPVDGTLGTLDEYVARHPEFKTRHEAAEARESEWKEKTRDALKHNFSYSGVKLEAQRDSSEPRKLLERALVALQRVDPASPSLTADPANESLVKDLNSAIWEMKKRFDRKGN